MIAGPVLGGFFPAAYYPFVAVATTIAPTPGGAADAARRQRPQEWGVPRYPGSRQRFEDGQWISIDEGLEQIGGPPREEPTPEAIAVADVLAPPIAEPLPVGVAGLGIALPPRVPRPEEIPRELPLGEWAKRDRAIARHNALVLTAILPHLVDY